jgi:hypothetical protein
LHDYYPIFSSFNHFLLQHIPICSRGFFETTKTNIIRISPIVNLGYQIKRHTGPKPCERRKPAMAKKKVKSQPPVLKKTLTGIKGLDEITGGGLPQGRPNPGLWKRRMRQDVVWDSIFGERGHAICIV